MCFFTAVITILISGMDRPDILERDAEMLAESGCNVVSLGIFAWSTLEPEEGVFRLDWMEQVIDRLYAKGIRVILATPSALGRNAG